MFLPVLEFIRGFAVICIFVRHIWGIYGSPNVSLGLNLDPIINQLNIGVDIFFVLSALVISISIQNSRKSSSFSYKKYLKARFFRIAPTYWLVLVISLLFLSPTFISPDSIFSRVGLQNFLSFFSFVHTMNPVSFGVYAPLSPFWTLTIEVVLYIVLPFILKLTNKISNLRLVFYGTLISIAWLVFVQFFSVSVINVLSEITRTLGTPRDEAFLKYFLSHQFPAYSVHFACGIAISRFIINQNQIIGTHQKSMNSYKTQFWVGIAIILSVMYLLGTLSIKYQFTDAFKYINLDSGNALIYFYLESIPYALGSSILLVALIRVSWKHQKIFQWKPLLFTGKIGYPIYLVHMPILFAFTKTSFFNIANTLSLRWLLLGVIPVIVIWSVAYFLHVSVEKPLQTFGKKVSKKYQSKGIKPRKLREQ